MVSAILKYVLILSLHIVSIGCQTNCETRRCLANELINKEVFSPPECIININLTSIQYETLSVVTKTLQFTSRIKIRMAWQDTALAWNSSQYNFTKIILPASKIWTPSLAVDNATSIFLVLFGWWVILSSAVTLMWWSVSLTVKPVYNDILVTRHGDVKYAVVMYVTTVCELDLFTFPFIQDSCPVAINGWNRSSCGLKLQYGAISQLGEGQGEWQTLSVELLGDNNKFLQVSLLLNPFNALVSLILPTGLIMAVDLVSFALPLNGERNPFKIKLVFSFTMFLLILSKQLPEGGTYNPLIYYHFCFCLFVLVVSLLLSMTLSQLARTGSMWPGKRQKTSGSDAFKTQGDNKIQENAIEMNGSSTRSAEVTTEMTSLKHISNFVNFLNNETEEKKIKEERAMFWDKICFWAYLCMDIIYMICVVTFFTTKS